MLGGWCGGGWEGGERGLWWVLLEGWSYFRNLIVIFEVDLMDMRY